MKRIVVSRLVVGVCLLALAGAVRADSLLAVWRTAQAYDPAYLAARQSLALAQHRATLYAAGSPQAQAQWMVARERFRAVEQDLGLRVARAYFNAAAARQAADLSLAQLNAMAQQLRADQRGGASEAELRDARARFEAARAQRTLALRDVDQRRAELGAVAGRTPETLEALRADAALWAPDPADAAFWAAQASQANPRVRLQEAALQAATQEVDLQREDGAPSVDVTASRSRIFSDGALSTPSEMAVRSRSAQLGLVLTVPLADSTPESRLREALTVQEKSEAELAVARSLAADQAQQAFSAVTQGLARSTALADLLRSGRTALDSLQAALRAGARLRSEAVQSVQQFYANERDWLKARTEALLQGLQLKAATGRLDEREIGRINALLVAAPATSLSLAPEPPQ